MLAQRAALYAVCPSLCLIIASATDCTQGVDASGQCDVPSTGIGESGEASAFVQSRLNLQGKAPKGSLQRLLHSASELNAQDRSQAPAPTPPAPAPLYWHSWPQTSTYSKAGAFCQAKGQDLCTQDQICPASRGIPVGGKRSGDQWVPFKTTVDSDCNWVAIGTVNRLCVSHEDHGYGCPDWSESSAQLTWRNWIACCPAAGSVPTATAEITRAGFVLHGPGLCSDGSYASAALDIDECAAKCASEPKCAFFSLKIGKSCNRYDHKAGSCTPRPSGHKDYVTYKKAPPEYKRHGFGSCATGLIANSEDSKDLDLKGCEAVCSSDVRCKYFALKVGEKCSVYDDKAGACTLPEGTSPFVTYLKIPVTNVKPIPEGFGMIGPGSCTTGDYIGALTRDAVELETCAAKCASDEKCEFFSLAVGKTCTVYDKRAGHCDGRTKDIADQVSYQKVVKDWLVSFADTCTDEELDRLCNGLGLASTLKCTLVAHASEKGVQLVNLRASEPALERFKANKGPCQVKSVQSNKRSEYQ